MSDRRMSTDPETLKTVIDTVRRCFGLLAEISDQSVADIALTASTRAILEHLLERGSQTVPQIASEKHIRRQSVQALVDRLLSLGFVRSAANPAHKKSNLIELTPEGRVIFEQVRQRELLLLRELGKGLDQSEMQKVADGLDAFKHQLTFLEGSGHAGSSQ